MGSQRNQIGFNEKNEAERKEDFHARPHDLFETNPGGRGLGFRRHLAAVFFFRSALGGFLNDRNVHFDLDFQIG